jgi:uncharacterized repeat protein (TIGR03833 family)
MSGTRRFDISPGTSVAIVLKCDQGSGRLTNGIVQSILTNSENHPRGIKVRLTSGQVGRVQHIGATSATHAAASDFDAPEDTLLSTRPAPSLGDWLQFPAPPTRTTTSAPPPVTPWVCTACTFENTNIELECEMCMTVRSDYS